MTKERKHGVQGMIKQPFSTDEVLVQRLYTAAKRTLTKEELHAQRVSFAFGNLPHKSDASRAKVEEVISKLEGAAA